MALRIATELLVLPSYKLRMFGIQIDVSAYVFFDNQSVTSNVTLPQLVLKKSHRIIFYHRANEAQAVEVIIVVWIQSEYNQDGLRTKDTLSKNISYKLVNYIMYNDIFMVLN